MKKDLINRLNSNSTKKSNWLKEQEQLEKKEFYIHDSQQIAIEMLSVIRKSGKKQNYFAELMGIPKQRLNKILKGNQNITLSTIKKIEKAFSLEIITPFEKERLKRAACQMSIGLTLNVQLLHFFTNNELEEPSSLHNWDCIFSNNQSEIKSQLAGLSADNFNDFSHAV